MWQFHTDSRTSLNALISASISSRFLSSSFIFMEAAILKIVTIDSLAVPLDNRTEKNIHFISLRVDGTEK